MSIRNDVGLLAVTGSILYMLWLVTSAPAGSIDNDATRPYVSAQIVTHAANTNLHIAAGNVYNITSTGSQDSAKLGGVGPEGYVTTNSWQAYTGQVASVCLSDPVATLDATRSNVTWIVLDTTRAFVPTSILTHARSGVSTQIWLWAYATNTAWDTTNGVIVTSPVSNKFYSAAVSYGTIPAHSRVGTIWNEAVTSITNAVGQLSGYEIP